MKRATKYVALAAVASVIAWSIGSTGLAVDRSAVSVPKRLSGMRLINQAAGKPVAKVLLATEGGQAQAVARAVRSLGGSVHRVMTDADFLVASVPSAKLQELERSSQVRAIAVDRVVKLDQNAMKPLSEKAQSVPSANDPALSLKITRGEIRAPQLVSQTGNDGTGTVVAILDTGVDPAHPALLKTTAGETKIIDWQDFTGEGDVETKESRSEAIAGIVSRSGTYRMGTFKESQIPTGEMNSDINRNGRSDDSFGVLVTDSAKAGHYDTVYVDTNANGDFTDEKPLRAYNQSFNVGTFGSTQVKDGVQQGVSFVVTRINPDGSGVNLGYDGGQHGTHVAGITAGNGPLTGVAPGAKVMAIKVLTSGGSGSWSGIVQGMHYAATHGAKVINMSLGGMSDLNDGNDPQSLLIKELSEKTGALFSIAAGNSGPGLNTMGLPGVAGAAITSGAYISTNTWKADYGLNVPQDGLWYFSSAGPRDDGGLKPNIVAPGTANAPIPTWAGQYAVFQGTSMAAPQTSGAIALLMGAAQYQGLKVTPDHLRMALETGARRLPGYGWYEQGHGLIQADVAWKNLRQIVKESNPELVSFGRAKAGTTASGLYAREFTLAPQDSKWALGNRELWKQQLDLSYLPGRGLTVAGPDKVTLPALQRKEVPLRFTVPEAPGVYDALIQARMPGQTSYAAQYLSTVIVPHEFQPAKGNVIRGISGSLGPARYGRHFVRVPAGTAELTVTLTVPNHQGRVRLMAYTPDGMPFGQGTNWAGGPDTPDKQTLTIPNPAPGVWEIDTYASHGAMNYGLAENKYTLDLAARGVYATPDRIALPRAYGQSITRTVSFANYYGEIQAAAAGASFAKPVNERVEVKHGGGEVKFFEVKEGTALVRSAVSQVLDVTAEIGFGLYYNDPQTGSWRPVGTVTGTAINKQVELLNPAPGQYAVEITGKNIPVGKTGMVWSLTRATVGGDSVAVAGRGSSRAFGSRWTVPVTFKVPSGFDAHVGAVVLRDENSGKVLAVVPVDVR